MLIAFFAAATLEPWDAGIQSALRSTKKRAKCVLELDEDAEGRCFLPIDVEIKAPEVMPVVEVMLPPAAVYDELLEAA